MLVLCLANISSMLLQRTVGDWSDAFTFSYVFIWVVSKKICCVKLKCSPLSLPSTLTEEWEITLKSLLSWGRMDFTSEGFSSFWTVDHCLCLGWPCGQHDISHGIIKEVQKVPNASSTLYFEFLVGSLVPGQLSDSYIYGIKSVTHSHLRYNSWLDYTAQG